MKQEKKVDIDMLYKDLRDYCFEVLVDNTNSWRGSIGGDEKAVRTRFAYIKGISDAVRFMDNMLMYYSEELGEENAQDEEDN